MYADGKKVESKDIVYSDDWKTSFDNLPFYNLETMEKINYTLTETPLDKFSTEITGDAENGFVVTNTLKSKRAVSVTKKWVGPATDKVTVILLADGVEVRRQELNANNNWSYTFENLEKYKGMNKIEYTVDELPIDGYTKEITGKASEGYVITNTNTEKISIPVEKKWVGQPGEKAEVILSADGAEVARATLTKADDWKHIFENLAKYDATTGNEINYTLKETEVAGYTATITGNASTGFVVVNTFKKQINDGSEINNSPNNGTHNLKNVPKTGDASELGQWFVLMVGAVVIALFDFKYRHKKEIE